MEKMHAHIHSVEINYVEEDVRKYHERNRFCGKLPW